MRKAVIQALLILCASDVAHGQGLPQFQISRAAQPPQIDGDLKDEVWRGEPLDIGDWLSYSPLYGEKAQQRTEVRIAYDDRNIYFAFHCFDTEPDKIRTTISRRDNVFNDDWIAMSLDSAGTGQTAYHLFVNPERYPDGRAQHIGVRRAVRSGRRCGTARERSQMMATSSRSGCRCRASDSPAAATCRWEFCFFAEISRTGVSYSWPDMPPGQWVFNRPAHLVFSDLKQPRLVEVAARASHMASARRAPHRKQWNEAIGKARRRPQRQIRRSRPTSRWTRPSIRTSARWKATRSRSR